jgi:hypothetical protein
MTAKKPRNYGATESTLTNNRKTRLDIAALAKRVRALEVAVLEMAADLLMDEAPVQIERPKPIGKGARA